MYAVFVGRLYAYSNRSLDLSGHDGRLAVGETAQHDDESEYDRHEDCVTQNI
jgi:hypothetical protein